MFKYVNICKGMGPCTTCVAIFKADKILWSWGQYFETFLENALTCCLMSAILKVNCGKNYFTVNFSLPIHIILYHVKFALRC